MEFTIPSPLQTIFLPTSSQSVWVKRDDQIHPYVSGNKWRKLKYNIEAFKGSDRTTILTFGGAFSNHLYATAAACEALGLKSIGIVRGLEADVDNPTLSYCVRAGMEIIKVSRTEYNEKERAASIDQIIKERNAFVIPEGGNNEFGQKGASEIMEEIINQMPSDDFYLGCSIGTGTTIKGLLTVAPAKLKLVGFKATQDDILTEQLSNYDQLDVQQMADPYKRFGSMDSELASYINGFHNDTSLPLDPLYTGKMMYTLEKLFIEKDLYKDKPFVFLHTGGLQGVNGYNYRFRNKQKVMINLPGITSIKAR